MGDGAHGRTDAEARRHLSGGPRSDGGWSPAPLVRTSSGAVRGRVDEVDHLDPLAPDSAGEPAGSGGGHDGVFAYEGIPYGSCGRRFAEPGPPPAAGGVLDAVRPGPAAPQTASRLERVHGPTGWRQDEECLTLNVWAPRRSPRQQAREPLPVLVFVHGGGFTSGTGGVDWYRGARLAARGRLVVVTINYRLGALGYLHLGGLGGSAGGPDEPGRAGNAGLADQIAALRWVAENIAGFGGDPDQVTLAGQSAGALSAVAMLAGSRARGLFHQVVLQSTPAIRPQTPAEATALAERYLALLGLSGRQAGRLAEVPVGRLLAAQRELAALTAAPGRVEPPFHLVADGALVPGGDLVDRAARGWGAGVARLVGDTRDEGRAFAPPARGDSAGADRFGVVDDESVTERYFRRDLDRLTRDGHRYRFDWHPAGNALGACHCIELPFVFGTLEAWRDAPVLAGADRGEESVLTDQVQRAWASFAHGDGPGGGGADRWPAYGPHGHVHRFDAAR